MRARVNRYVIRGLFISILATSLSGISQESAKADNCIAQSGQAGLYAFTSLTLSPGCTFIVPYSFRYADVLLVAGGGGGGGAYDNGAGGGGGGGQVAFYSQVDFAGIETMSVIVGDGGEGGSANRLVSPYEYSGQDGGNTSLTFGSTNYLVRGGKGGNKSRIDALNRTAGTGGAKATASSGALGGAAGGGGGGGSVGNGGTNTGNTVARSGGAGYYTAMSGYGATYGTGGTGGAGNSLLVGANAYSRSGDGGGGGSAQSSSSARGGGGAQGFITFKYLVSQAPVIYGPGNSFETSSAISIQENLSTIYDFRDNSFSTWAISGTDSQFFSINSSTGLLSISPRDYESPTDSNSDNVYRVTVTATGQSGISTTQIVSVTITNAISEPAILGTLITSVAPAKGKRTTLSLPVNAAGKVTFYSNNKRIPGCIGISTAGSAGSYSASCTWKPAVRGQYSITATFIPTEIGFITTRTLAKSFVVSNRADRR